MTTDDLTTARLDLLELRCRRLTIGTAGLGMALLAVVTMGSVVQQGIPEEFRVRKLIVIDEEGKSRALLGCDEQAAGLSLLR